MGVILCTSPTGPFSVTVIPKCGSTTVRTMLAPHAKPGQYRILEDGTVEKLGGWKLETAFRGQCGLRSWGVLRSPWRRLLSRWIEKGTPTWPEYVSDIAAKVMAGRHPMARSQSAILGGGDYLRPFRLVAIENVAEWAPEMARIEGVAVTAGVHARTHGAYDWQQTYRDHPETRDIVRNIFAADWDLGLDWQDPLE